MALALLYPAGIISFIFGNILILNIIPEATYIDKETKAFYEKSVILKENSELEKIKNVLIAQIEIFNRNENLEFIQNMNPYTFEQFVARIFTYFWYNARVTKWSWDKWIDINLIKDGEKQIVQCKRYKKKIGTPIIRDFIGTMNLSQVQKWYIVTTSDFSFEVVNMLNDKRHDIRLIDINTLIRLQKTMNDWEKASLDQIIEEGMSGIRGSAREAEFNQFEARRNYQWPNKRRYI